MKNSIGSVFLITTFLLSTHCTTVVKEPVADNILLSLVLTKSFDDGGYTVVSPQTHIENLKVKNSMELKKLKQYVGTKMKIPGVNLDKIIDLLVKRNMNSVRLTLRSSPQKGYIIDYDGKFKKYFSEHGAIDWDKWYNENPTAHGWTSVSLPAYCPKSDVFLVYKGFYLHAGWGLGLILAFKYDNYKITELARVMIWIS